MNIILLPSGYDPEPHRARDVTLQGDQARHILTIIKPAIGDHLRVGVLNGNMGLGKIISLHPDSVQLSITLTEPPPVPLPATLLLALPRPKVLKRVLQSSTSLGIKQIYLINSYRVEKSYWQSPFLHPDVIRRQLILGLEQGRDTLLPEVHLRPRFKPFVEDELPAIAEQKQCFTAHPADHNPPCPTAVHQPSVLAIGPEGGFIPYEIDKLAAAGFSSIALGQRILKVETAIPALIARMFL